MNDILCLFVTSALDASYSRYMKEKGPANMLGDIPDKNIVDAIEEKLNSSTRMDTK